MSVTRERKCASRIGLALKEKKTAMWQISLKTTNYNSFYLSPQLLCNNSFIPSVFESGNQLFENPLILHF